MGGRQVRVVGGGTVDEVCAGFRGAVVQVRAVFSHVRLPVSIRQNPHQPAANQM